MTFSHLGMQLYLRYINVSRKKSLPSATQAARTCFKIDCFACYVGDLKQNFARLPLVLHARRRLGSTLPSYTLGPEHA